MAIQSAARTAGRPMITESEIVSPPPRTWMAAATSNGPSCRSTNQATTAICPTNIAAKTNSPHRAVPQNFQILGWRWMLMTGVGAAGTSELKESIKNFQLLVRRARAYPDHDERRRSSRQRPLQQTPDIVAREIDGAVHAGVIPGQARGCEQFRLMRRHLVQGGRCREQRQLLDREPGHALGVRPAKCLADGRRRAGGTRQSRSFLDKVLQNGRRRLRSRDSARSTSRHITLPE